MPSAREGATPTLGAGDAPASPEQGPGSVGAGIQDRALTTRQLAWRRFKRHKLAMASAIILIVITLLAIFAPLLSKYNYHETFTGPILDPISAKHWFGTDELGRDEFSRVLYGGRVSLVVGFAVAISAGIIGTLVGAIAGFYGGWIDNVLMRVTDLFLAMPFLVILIVGSRLPIFQINVFSVVPLGIILLLSVFFWMPDARIVRGLFLSLKEKEFTEAARAMGATNKRIIFYHILPNTMGPIIVTSTLNVAAAILTESALSFLGFGVQPPIPTWGGLLEEARGVGIQVAPALTWYPGLAILLTVLCVNFLGDGLRDALDPHQRLVG